MQKHSVIICALFVLTLMACGDRRKQGLELAVKDAQKGEIQYFLEGGDTLRVPLIGEDNLRRITDAMSDSSGKEADCAKDGMVVFMKDGKVTFEAKFSLEGDCIQFDYSIGEKRYHSLINGNGLKYLTESRDNVSTLTQLRKMKDNLAWLAGTWVAKSGKNTFRETWISGGTGMMSGYAHEITPKGDTVFSERFNITRKENVFVYNMTAKGSDSLVSYPLQKAMNQELLVENPEAGFPSRIHYKAVGSDSAEVVIDGKEGGKEKQRRFMFAREK